MKQLTDEQLLAAFNSCEKVIDGLHAVAELAKTVEAQPAADDKAHVGESAFEGWYSTYNPMHKSDKQRALDAYAAGMSDDKACWCEQCDEKRNNGLRTRMSLCPDCGNKRCPKATHHDNACTDSNEVGQKGSSWEHVKPITCADDKAGGEVEGWLYDWTHSSAIGKPDEKFTGFTKDEQHARNGVGHENVRPCYTHSKPQAIPAGYAIVPVEPTPEMIENGRWSEFAEETSRLFPVDDDAVRSVYSDMIAAAPKVK